MRHIVLALAVIVLAGALALEGPHVQAAKSSEFAQIEKRAGKSAKKIAKAYAKRIRSDASAAAKRIKALAKAAKSGKNIEELSGVPSTGKTEVTTDQLKGLLDAYVDVRVDFGGDLLSNVEFAFADLISDPNIVALANTTSELRLPGSGGPGDQFAVLVQDAALKGSATVDKASSSFDGAVTGRGFSITRIDCPPPKFAAPFVGATSTQAIAGSHLLGAVGSPCGTIDVLVGSDADPLSTGSGPALTLFDDSGTRLGSIGAIATNTLTVRVNTFDELGPGAYSVGLTHVGTGGLDTFSRLLVGVPEPLEPTSGPVDDLVESTTVAITENGSPRINEFVDLALVQADDQGLDRIRIQIHDSSDGDGILSFDLFTLQPQTFPVGQPFDVFVPEDPQGTQSNSLFYFPDGLSGDQFFVDPDNPVPVQVTLGGDPSQGPIDLIVVGDVRLQTFGGSGGTILVEFDIRIDASDTTDVFPPSAKPR
jgi:hypothetical protein